MVPAQKHFLKTICGPNSSYSSALIQAPQRSAMLARAAPPRHTEKSRSLGLLTLTLRSTGHRRRISCCRRTGSPDSSVFPPERERHAYTHRERERERESDIHTQRERATYTHRERESDRQTDTHTKRARETHTHTQRERGRQRETHVTRAVTNNYFGNQ